MFFSFLQALIDKTGINPNEVGDIVVGIVLAPGSQRASARWLLFMLDAQVCMLQIYVSNEFFH